MLTEKLWPNWARSARLVTLMTVALIALVAAGCGSSGDDEEPAADTDRALQADAIYDGEGTVAFLAPSVTISIWADAWVPQFASWMKQVAPNVEVLDFYAEFDPSKQLTQAKAAVAQGAKVLVIASVDPNEVGGICDYAEQNDVTILASNRQFLNCEIAGYVSDDATAIGALLAGWAVDNTDEGATIATLWGDATDAVYAPVMREGANDVLTPLDESGERTVVGDLYTKEYSSANAQRAMSAILTQADNEVDAVISANDDIAAGAASAVQAAGADGTTKVIGSDATIAGVQNVLRGRLAMTVYHSIRNQEILAKAVAYLLADEEVPADFFPKTIDNGEVDGKKIEVPYRDDPPMAITAANVQRLIDDKFLTKELICDGIGSGNQFCQ
jgi:D-xylose transport system substrate-binding protein